MKVLLENNRLVLMEAAIVEQLRRADGVRLHDRLVNAPLIYDPAGRQALRALYERYIDIATEAETPLLLCTPTWRANEARVRDAGAPESINGDAAAFMRDVCESRRDRSAAVRVGGMIGCKHDCYQPADGLSASDAEGFHGWQIERLARGGVDFLIAETLPSVDEAVGIARAMEQTRLPYIISFVINRDGHVLDGSRLVDATCRIDSSTDRQPLGYMVNCAYPTFLHAATQPRELFSRLIGYQANASSLDHCDLDQADALEAEDVSEWGAAMLDLNRSHGVTILGGCCGTGPEHLRYLASEARTVGRAVP